MASQPAYRRVVPLQTRRHYPNTLLTLRGLLLLACLFYLLIDPVKTQADIIASILAYCSLGLFVGLLIISAVIGTKFRRDLELNIQPPHTSQSEVVELSAGSVGLIMIRTSAVNLWPLFQLEVEVMFEHPGLTQSRHTLRGSALDGFVITESLSFPHRGIWRVRRVLLNFGDQFGLSALHWTVRNESVQQSFVVKPKRRDPAVLPILSSSHRSGEDEMHLHERQGDPYDLKRYHPSDGMKKIVWKMFAKSGKLISRHPEPSVTPEGQVVLFCFARSSDDHVCSDILGYMQRLSELELEILFGCEGMRDEPLARTTVKAEELLIESVWNTKTSNRYSLRDELTAFLKLARNQLPDVSIERILLFCAPDRFAEPEFYGACLDIGSILEQERVEPIYCISKPEGGTTRFTATSDSKLDLLGRRTLELFIQPLETTPKLDLRAYHSFLNLCSSKHWQVIV